MDQRCQSSPLGTSLTSDWCRKFEADQDRSVMEPSNFGQGGDLDLSLLVDNVCFRLAKIERMPFTYLLISILFQIELLYFFRIVHLFVIV